MSDSAANGRLLSALEGILGPDPLDVLREKLIAEFGSDVALPVMRIVRPAVEQMRAESNAAWRGLRDEYLALLHGDDPAAA